MKICTKCEIQKDENQYYRDTRLRSGLTSSCKQCISVVTKNYSNTPKGKLVHKIARAHWSKTPNGTKIRKKIRKKFYKSAKGKIAGRRENLRYLYNLSIDDFNELLISQNGCCAICGTAQSWGKGTFHVDHDHRCCPGKKSCGKCIRGLLCGRCNSGIGYLNDDFMVCFQAMRYLEKFK